MLTIVMTASGIFLGWAAIEGSKALIAQWQRRRRNVRYNAAWLQWARAGR